MIRNYILSAYRSLLKNKIYGAINILGLTVGIACCLLISLYVMDELSYDKFLKDNDRIYRIALERKYPTNTRLFGTSPVNLAPTLLENYPEVEEAGRLHKLFFQTEVEVLIEGEVFVEDKYLFADSNFFKVFSFKFIEGNPKTALNAPDKVVITESIAKKYFGETSALNKTYRIDTARFQIAGVIEDVPSNSHLKFELLGSIKSLGFLNQAASTNNWVSPWLFTYVKLKDEVVSAEFEAKLPDVVRNYGMASIESGLGISAEDFPTSGNAFNYFLQPIKDIHLKSNLDVEVAANSDIRYVYLLSAVVIFILLISCINFINLATARSAERAREVGIRKVMGSDRFSLIRQFLIESNIIVMVALLISLVLVWAMLPAFNLLVGKTLSLFVLLKPIYILGLIVFGVLVGTLAGIYPALMISSIKSAVVLKGEYKSSSKGIWIRNTLIIFQFFVSITMISAMLMLNKQMNFMREKQLGFDKENLIVLEQVQELGQNQQSFRSELIKVEGIESATYGFAMPGEFIGNFIANAENPETPQLRTFTVSVDDDYIATLNMEIVEGRNFSPAFEDSANVIVNETAVQLLDYPDPVGRKIIRPNPQPNQVAEYTIIGVVKDYHHLSLHTEIPPMVLFNVGEQAILPKLGIRLSNGNVSNTLKKIEAVWQSFENERPLSYSFIDENLDSLYRSDIQTGRIFTIFTVVTIFMACVGLFGLAAYVTQQRTKEIGIRKVLGSTITSIILLLSADFSKLILVSFVASLPLVYYGMTEWLNNFAYHTEIDFLTLGASGGLTLLLALLTISYYSIKIAIVNPVKSLRNE